MFFLVLGITAIPHLDQMDWLAMEAFTGQLGLLREIVAVQGRSFP
jgi:hypothetical protein